MQACIHLCDYVRLFVWTVHREVFDKREKLQTHPAANCEGSSAAAAAAAAAVNNTDFKRTQQGCREDAL